MHFAQTDRALARLLGQPEEWNEYARLWEEQRGHSIWENKDYSARQSAAKGASGSRNDAAKVGASQVPEHVKSDKMSTCLDYCRMPCGLDLSSASTTATVLLSHN